MKLHIGHEIRTELLRQGRSVTWLVARICCSRTHVYRIFEKDNIDIILLFRISNILGHDFFGDLSREYEGLAKSVII